MRLVGAAERAMDLMVQRANQRKAFGKTLAQQGSFAHMIAKVCFFRVFSTYHFSVGLSFNRRGFLLRVGPV